MQFGQCSLSTFPLSSQFILHICILLQDMEYFFGRNISAVGRYSLYQRKLSEF